MSPLRQRSARGGTYPKALLHTSSVMEVIETTYFTHTRAFFFFWFRAFFFFFGFFLVPGFSHTLLICQHGCSRGCCCSSYDACRGPIASRARCVSSVPKAALRTWSDVPKAHFLRFMNCMLHRELQGSLDSLHRYFDYPARRGGPTVSDREGFLDLARDAAQGGGSSRHTPQHAALALARLHFE